MARARKAATKRAATLASDRLVAAINQQIGNEMGASLQYTSISAYFESENLPQLAAFFERQSSEERVHALKFVRFVVDVGGRVEIPAVAAPRSGFDSASEAVRLSLDWERTVTEQIYALVEIAREERNHIAQRFLDWFVNEQLEEINSMDRLLAMVGRAADNLLLVEEYLARNPILAPPGESAGAGAE